LKILFFGLGSIGRRHAKILMEGYDHELYAFRTMKGQLKDSLGIKEITRWDQIERIAPDVAFITNPTYLHIKTALCCAKNGMHLFIEKPISNTMQGIDELIKITRRKRKVAYVGFNLRFHPILQEMKRAIGHKQVLYSNTIVTSYLPNWRKGQDYRKSYSADSKKGGGILLDLFHELDYNQWLFGDVRKINGRYGRVSDLDIDAEDYADLLLDFSNGTLGTIHMSWYSHNEQRKVVAYCRGGTYHADLIENKLSRFIDGKLDNEVHRAIPKDYTYREQLKSFMGLVARGDTRSNNLEVSRRLLKALLEFKSAGMRYPRVNR
jgi:predicted dehydrogenase